MTSTGAMKNSCNFKVNVVFCVVTTLRDSYYECAKPGQSGFYRATQTIQAYGTNSNPYVDGLRQGALVRVQWAACKDPAYVRHKSADGGDFTCV